MELLSAGDLPSAETHREAMKEMWLHATGAAGKPIAFHCCACGIDATVDTEPGGLREQLTCPGCGLNSRQRAAVWIMQQNGPGRRIYITEQATRPFVWLQSQCLDVVGSEFVASEEVRHHLRGYLHAIGGTGDIRFEDATALSFRDESLDCILSFDVLEHVPDYCKALSEFSRTLRQGGMLIATFPFLDDKAETLVRAEMRDGQVVNLEPPEYHGDPVNGDGVLCFYHFGFDIVESVKAAGFSTAAMVMPHAPKKGIPFGCWTLVATK